MHFVKYYKDCKWYDPFGKDFESRAGLNIYIVFKHIMFIDIISTEYTEKIPTAYIKRLSSWIYWQTLCLFGTGKGVNP